MVAIRLNEYRFGFQRTNEDLRFGLSILTEPICTHLSPFDDLFGVPRNKFRVVEFLESRMHRSGVAAKFTTQE